MASNSFADLIVSTVLPTNIAFSFRLYTELSKNHGKSCETFLDSLCLN